jgi:hypothetical protein
MLSDRYCQLLTAYVDDEVSERERQAALRLLAQSPEARSLLKRLQENAEKVKSLPTRTLGPDFTRALLHKVGELQPATIPLQRAAAVRGVPAWIGGSVAAAILLTVMGVSYWFFNATKQAPEVANVPAPEVREDRGPLVASIIQGTVSKFGESGLHLNVVDLAQEKTQTRLTSELKSENAVHMELGCTNSAQAVDGLNQVLQKSGVKIVVDANAQAKLKTTPKTEILVYAENLSLEELTAILKQLGTTEQTKSAGDRQLKSLHVEAMSATDRAHVARLFGVDTKQLQPPPRELGKFIPAPQAGKKDKGENKAVKPAPRPDKLAMVIANEFGQDPAASPELQRFLESRRRAGQQPGTLQVVLVVRPAAA